MSFQVDKVKIFYKNILKFLSQLSDQGCGRGIMKKPAHFYIVFNPMVNHPSRVFPTQAHEFYHKLKSQPHDAFERFLYWGKLAVDINPSNINHYQNVINYNKHHGLMTHLYITDYHHFWVAKVESVHDKIVNYEKTLEFYNDKNVEAWFKISDMDLISSEFEETGFYLNQLYVDNEFESLKLNSISPYQGGLHFPLIVQDNNEDRYFQINSFGDTLRMDRENALIENPKLIFQMRQTVNSFVLPPHVYSKLSPTLKNEILNVETRIFQTADPNETQIKILTGYSNILELTLNQFLGEVLRKDLGSYLFISTDGSKISNASEPDYVSFAEFSGVIRLEAIMTLLKDFESYENISIVRFKKDWSNLIEFLFKNVFPLIEKFELLGLPSQGLKGKSDFPISSTYEFRNSVLGVGCKGVINNMFYLTLETEGNYQSLKKKIS